ncbi:MAG TPA: 4-hydroxy-tetrahydrodipicolinate reductase [Candidatus Choladousia intestinigallinarum]|nr:4-hydroxy-tetrahydrodipicolinate reductase [Candidatus Choladousia intestinigallinarum]
MIRMILSGCCGFMGRVVTEIADGDPDIQIVAGIDPRKDDTKPYPVYGTPAECQAEGDVLVDFSSAQALGGLLKYCVEKQVPAVLCSTGYSQEQLDEIQEASGKVAVLKSANMSLGVNLLLKLLKEAAKTLAPAGFDMEIVERHHNRKVDAPSGTALALADSLNEALNQEYTYTYDRSQVRRPRDKKEIGISAVRGGSIVGDHEVIFAGLDEVIEFKHTAYSRSIFAKGAVSAAKYLAGKPAGLYNMGDVIG